MEINAKLTKQISEVKYLTAENVERYRSIIRFFYMEYQGIKYQLYKEEVFEALMSSNFFSDYTLEKCQSDLDALCEWKNLIAFQDTSKVTSIAEYRTKRFRYQLTEYTVEIERMILKLENLQIEGASLEPSLLERIQLQLAGFSEMMLQSDERVHSWWKDLNNDFIRLNQNYQDYIRTLNNHKAEEMMKSHAFLLFKDKLLIYLRTFVKGLQDHGSIVSIHLKHITEDQFEMLIEKVVRHELSIPRVEQLSSASEIESVFRRRWQNINDWFIGDGYNNELDRFFEITNDIIRKITRYAQQIGEMRHRYSNRKQEYLHLAGVFSQCETINEAHCLSAVVFGVSKPFHLHNLKSRQTDDIDSPVFLESATTMEFEPRTRIVRKASIRHQVEDVAFQQQQQRQQIEEQLKTDQKLLMSYLADGVIDCSQLPVIDSYSRKMLLTWINKALQNQSNRAKTDFGMEYYLDLSQVTQKCIINCEDGVFTMPHYILVFNQEGI